MRYLRIPDTRAIPGQILDMVEILRTLHTGPVVGSAVWDAAMLDAGRFLRQLDAIKARQRARRPR